MKTILCVDDQESGLEIRKLLLEAQGYRVLTAATGNQAFDTVRREVPDLVVLDYRLTDISGEEVAKILKRDHPSLPILLLSGYPQIPESAKSAVNAFVVKGDPTDTFLRSIESLLAPDNSESSAPQKILERSEELMERSYALTDRIKRRRSRS
jgi:CheY-like chemotaxis protein